MDDVIAEMLDGELDNGWLPSMNETHPRIWDGVVPMDAYLDCCMHLLFHGIVAYVIEIMDGFMAHHGLTKKFEREVNGHLLELCLLRLDWCKVKTLPKNSGWQRTR